MSRVPDFANYPRQRLRLRWQRRDLLTSLLTEMRLRSDRSGGGVRIPDLGLYPDELIELLTPSVRGEFKPQGDRDYVTAVELMNGERTIEQVAAELEHRLRWDRQHAFQYARGVFLDLVSRGKCLPIPAGRRSTSSSPQTE